jgi:hypothetical protein
MRNACEIEAGEPQKKSPFRGPRCDIRVIFKCVSGT